MAGALNHYLGLHCLLYLVADRICQPETALPDGSVADALSANEHRLARVVGSAIKAVMWDPPKVPDNLRVFVPCRPTLGVLKKELAPRLLMGALLECRDLGLVELRQADGRGWRGLPMWDPGLVKIIPLVTPAVGGLCGQIMKRLEGKGKQGVVQLFDGVIHGTPGKSASMRFGEITRASGERWVIDLVESELADRGYMRATVAVRRWPPGRRVQAVVDCEQIQSLAQDCVLAVDRWHRAWAADATLCKAVLDGCAESMWDRRGGG